MVTGEDTAWTVVRFNSQSHIVYHAKILGEQSTVTVYQRSKSSWEAVGDVGGRRLAEKGRSELGARRAWYRHAYIRLDC